MNRLHWQAISCVIAAIWCVYWEPSWLLVPHHVPWIYFGDGLDSFTSSLFFFLFLFFFLNSSSLGCFISTILL